MELVGPSGHRYNVDEAPFAAGGQGDVWGATRDDGMVVAIKRAGPRPDQARSLEREADFLHRLRGAGVTAVVPVLDVLDWDGRPAMAMPRCPGHAEAWVRRLIELSRPEGAVEDILGFAARVADALAQLHQADLGEGGRLVHRDIKPENLLVTAKGEVLLCDLGGTLVVSQLRAARRAVFGSPLWAPFDQVLPGLPEVNPTWDTYALCVAVFWWITHARPAYQADPSPMMTERGRAIWAAWCALAAATPEGDPQALREASIRLQAEREGTREADLVDVRGHAAIQDADLELLRAGFHRLASVERYGEPALLSAANTLGVLLGRGLSPVSHPSPPNRYWQAAELGDALRDVAARLRDAREARVAKSERAGLEAKVKNLSERALPPTALPIGGRPERAVPRKRSIWPGVLVGLMAAAVLSLPLVYVVRERLGPDFTLTGGSTPLGTTTDTQVVSLDAVTHFPVGPTVAGRTPTTVAVASFRLDRLEVSTESYLACVDAGVCGAPAWKTNPTKAHDYDGRTNSHQPIVGVDRAQAAAYCAWKGGRLPTSEEWERAATWPATPDLEAVDPVVKQSWPWGNAEPTCELAKLAGCGTPAPSDVGADTAGATPEGLLDLVGNVAEWTSTDTTEARFLKRVTKAVVRGGSYNTRIHGFTQDDHRTESASGQAPDLGFRCAYAAP